MSGDGQDATEHLLSSAVNRQRLEEALAQATGSPRVHRSRTCPVDREEAAAILRVVLPLVDAMGESLRPSGKAVIHLAQFIATIRHDERLAAMVRLTSDELETDLYGGSEGSRAVDDVAEAGTTDLHVGTASGPELQGRVPLEAMSAQPRPGHGPADLATVLEQVFPWVERLPVAYRRRFFLEVEEWRNTAEGWSDPDLAGSPACEVREPETDAAARAWRVAGAVAWERLVRGAQEAPTLQADPIAAKHRSAESLAETGGPLTPGEAASADGVLGRSPGPEERRGSLEVDVDFEFDPPRLGLTGRESPDFSVDDVVKDLESVPGIDDDLEQRMAARRRWEEAHRYRSKRLAEASAALAAIAGADDLVRQVDRVREVLAGIGVDSESQDLWLTAANTYLDGATPLEAIGEGLLEEVEYAARQRGHV